MILCLDAGNTRLKFGLHDGRGWRRQGVLSHEEIDSRGQYDDIGNLGELVGICTDPDTRPLRIVACNVAGTAVGRRIETFAARNALTLDWLTGSTAACGVRNGYDTPRQLGADRWAALIGAQALHRGAAVVVMAGTATTIDTIDDKGFFHGGLILPGLSLMRTALARNTDGLPHATGHYRMQPTNTDDAIVSGAIHATLGAIERMRAALGEGAPCLLSGGAAAELAPYLTQPLRTIDNLVLEGLARYGQTAVTAVIPS